MASFSLVLFITIFTIINQHVESASNTIDVPDVVKEINHHNRKSGNLWEATTYGYESLDLEDLIKQRLGTKLSRSSGNKISSDTAFQVEHQAPASSQASDSLPKYFNWANTTKATNCPIGTIRDQANCGSCWAISTASAFSDRVCIKSKGKITIPLSGDHITACDKSNYGCDGGLMDRVNQFVQKYGVVTGGEYESDQGCKPYSKRPCGYPHQLPCAPESFTPKCGGLKCTNDWYRSKYEKPKNIFKAKKWYFMQSESAIMKEIYENGPVTAGFAIYLDFIFYKGGIYIKRPNMPLLGGHAVKVVGWGEERGIKYWIVANSWSPSWGEKGYFRIQRGVNMCYFESEISALIPDV